MVINPEKRQCNKQTAVRLVIIMHQSGQSGQINSNDIQSVSPCFLCGQPQGIRVETTGLVSPSGGQNRLQFAAQWKIGETTIIYKRKRKPYFGPLGVSKLSNINYYAEVAKTQNAFNVHQTTMTSSKDHRPRSTLQRLDMAALEGDSQCVT